MDKTTVDKFMQTYHAALPHFDVDTKQHAVKGAQAMGFADVSSLGSFQQIEQNICTSWPGTRTFMLNLISRVGWVPGISAYAASAKAIIEAVDKTIIPMVCGVEAPAANQAKPTVATPTKNG